MNSYTLATAAYRDLRKIRAWLTREASEAVADRVEAELYHGFDELERLPWVGHSHGGVSDATLLFYKVFEYAIVFRRTPQLLILRVVHGKRDLKKIL